MNRQAVILAGGLGTRLRERLGGRPKALAEVGGKPLLEHQLRLCARHGFTDIVLLLGHAAEAIVDFVGDGAAFGVRVSSVVETRPLGTAGAVLSARHLLRDRFLVLYADTMLDVDLGRLWDHHARRAAAVTLLVHPNDHPFDSDLVIADTDDRVTAFFRGGAVGDAAVRNLASAALYVVESRSLARMVEHDTVLDFGKHVFPALLAQGATIAAYRSVEYIKDAGTPERLDHVNDDYRSERVRPEASGRPLPAVFLDRDGTLNVEIDGVRRPDQLELIAGVAPALRRFNKAGIATIVVTNQPFVARGEVTEAGIDAIHARLEQQLAREGAYVDAIYYCPHHPHSGFAGERPELKFVCPCRKPAPGMLLAAASALNLDLTDAWMIGDRPSDVAAGRRAGVRTVLLQTGAVGPDGQIEAWPDYVLPDLSAAAAFIIDRHPRMLAKARTLAAAIRPGATIAIGGLAYSGKSSWTAVIAEALGLGGIDHFVLSLDDWRLDRLEGGTDGVEAGHDLAGAARFLEGLRRLDEPTDVAFVRSIGPARRWLPKPAVARFVPGSVVLIDGIAALALPGLALDALRIIVRAPESVRRERMERDHGRPGRREADETSAFEATGVGAAIELDGAC